MLARSLQEKKTAIFILKIKSHYGEQVYTAPHIALFFGDFYADLYTGRDKLTPEAIEERHRNNLHYLQQAQLPKLPSESMKKMKSELTEEEFYAALKTIPSGKPPGPDGYIISYYKKFKEILVPYPTSYANSIVRSGGITYCTYIRITKTRDRFNLLQKTSAQYHYLTQI